jgi:Domain of unknown function (DUF222)/HNH endonuclease
MSEILEQPVADIGAPLRAGDVAAWLADLRRLDDSVEDAERVEQLRALEELKSAAAAAAQARVAVAFDVSQRAEQQAAGVHRRDLGSGVAAQVGLARRDSPVKGARHLGVAKALVGEMPHTLAALGRGEISEWRATVIVRETACLSRADRMVVDAELAARPGGLGGLGDATTAAETRAIGYRLDPYAFTARARRAESERRVSIRPAPETMTMVTGLLPARQGVAVYAALARQADALRSAGDRRSRGQIMADTFVERITGQSTAAGVPVEVELVMDASAMLAHDDTPALLEGYGPVPAPLARQWLRELPEEAGCWLRRLFVDPGTDRLVALESTRRVFTGLLRRFIMVRDRTCRTPWCDAPIRHVDHVEPAAAGGPTSAENAQGLCEACNYAKQAPGWAAATDTPDGAAGAGGAVETRTPPDTATTARHHAGPVA